MIKIKRLVKDKKGAIESLYHVIGVIMLLLSLGAFLDFMIVQQKIQTSNQFATEVARVAGIQGGILNRAPLGYPGGSRAYINSKDIMDMAERVFQGVGITSDRYRIKINGTTITNTRGSSEIDYKSPIEVEVAIQYDYMFLGRVLGWRDVVFTSRRVAVSEWKYNYDSWDGE